MTPRRFGALTLAGLALAAGAGCSGSGGSGDDESDDSGSSGASALATACGEVAEVLQPDDFEEGDGALDYAQLAAGLDAIASGADAEVTDVLQPLIDAANARAAVAEADAAASAEQETLLADPSALPSELATLEPGEEATYDLPSDESAAAANEELAAADEQFQAAQTDVGSACAAEGAPLVDPSASEQPTS